MKLNFEYGHKTAQELVHLQEHGCLNLEPGFQRKSVWRASDRRKLVQSILDGYPIPSIFLYKRADGPRIVYDVIDGKQRLETLFMFMGAKGFKRKGFDVPILLAGDDAISKLSYRQLEKRHLNTAILGYKVQTVEVSGELGDIIDLFVRINATGKALTAAERRSARFYNNQLLREAKKLAGRQAKYLAKERVVTPGQRDRMKDVELITELLISIHSGGPIHKKTAVDKAVGNYALPKRQLMRAAKDLTAAINVVKKLCPQLHATRFHKLSEFYTLVLLAHSLRQQNMVLNDPRRMKQAGSLLTAFSDGVDRARERQRRARGTRAGERVYADYLLTVQSQTDNQGQRQRRAKILEGVLAGLFERKDDRRSFSPEQRRLMWNSDERKRCSGCDVQLDWTNFTIDHVDPHSLGGKTSLSNAALLCGPCNSAKGAGRRRRARSARSSGRGARRRR